MSQMAVRCSTARFRPRRFLLLVRSERLDESSLPVYRRAQMSHDERVQLKSGRVVGGRYRVERELGRGGFARVYESVHTDLERRAALKVIDLPSHPGSVDQFVKRFLQEARVAANLSHPNVVTVYDYGVIDATGQPYLAMELLDGRDLEGVLESDGKLGAERAVELMLPVLDALDLAQSNGIVHKDLKPSNLFLVDAGNPRERLVLLDFGIARIYTDENSRFTQTGGFTGTPAYMAPEYIREQQVTPAVDVYQCGLILAEMITGTPVVGATSSMECLIKHSQGDVEVPAALRSGPLGAVLARTIVMDPKARFANCGELRDALAAIDLSSAPGPTTIPGPTTASPSRRSNEYVSTFESSDTLRKPPPESSPMSPTRSSRTEGGASLRIWAAASALVALATLVGVGLVLLLDRAETGGETSSSVASVPAPPPEPEPGPAEESTPESTPPPARAEIRTIPSGASVRIDGEPAGTTPVVLTGDAIPSGEVSVEISRDEFQTEKRTVQFVDGLILDSALQPAGESTGEKHEASKKNPKPGKKHPKPGKKKRKKRQKTGKNRGQRDQKPLVESDTPANTEKTRVLQIVD